MAPGAAVTAPPSEQLRQRMALARQRFPRLPPHPDFMSELDSLLEALAALHPRRIDLSLDRIQRLLDRLDRPQDRLPPVIHVAGTNGKGSTVAFLRAMLEAAGLLGPRLHLAASGALQRAHPARPAGWRQARRRRDADRGDRGGAARQWRRADHLLRGDHGGGLPSLCDASGGLLPARGRPRRPLRRHQRHRPAARRRDLRRSATTTPISSARTSPASPPRRPAS